VSCGDTSQIRLNTSCGIAPGENWGRERIVLGNHVRHPSRIPSLALGLARGPRFIQARNASKGMCAACTSGAEPNCVTTQFCEAPCLDWPCRAVPPWAVGK
jgi:hypothetical protein